MGSLVPRNCVRFQSRPYLAGDTGGVVGGVAVFVPFLAAMVSVAGSHRSHCVIPTTPSSLSTCAGHQSVGTSFDTRGLSSVGVPKQDNLSFFNGKRSLSSCNPRASRFDERQAFLRSNSALFRSLGIADEEVRFRSKFRLGQQGPWDTNPPSIKEEVTWLMDDLDFGRDDIVKVLQYSPQLFSGFNTLPKMQDFVNMFFDEAGVSKAMVKKMILRHPKVLRYYKRFEPHLQCYARMIGMSKVEMLSMLLLQPQLLSLSIESNVQDKINRMLEQGLAKEEIRSIIVKNPSIICKNIDENFSKLIDWMCSEVGFEKRDAINLLVKRPLFLISKVEALQATYQWFNSQGVGLDASFFQKNFSVLCLRLDSIKRKYNFARNVLKKPPKEIMACGVYFTLSLEERIMFRTSFLMSIGRDVNALNLGTMFVHSNGKFFRRYKKEGIDSYKIYWEGLEDSAKVNWFSN